MADRTSAEVFGLVFEMLAKKPTDENKEMARQLWKKTDGYDFGPSQMDCDAALKKLGLARKGVDPDYPEDGETMVYGPEKKRTPTGKASAT